MNLSIHYTYNTIVPTLLQYSPIDRTYITVNMKMWGFLTPEILSNHLLFILKEEVPMDVVEMIIGYSEFIENGKDVTVLFSYTSFPQVMNNMGNRPR